MSTDDDLTPIRRTEQPDGEPAPQPQPPAVPTPTWPTGLARRAGAMLAASTAALAVVYGTHVALSLTAVIGRRAELLLSIQPGPLAAGGGTLALVLACRAHRRARRPRA